LVLPIKGGGKEIFLSLPPLSGGRLGWGEE